MGALLHDRQDSNREPMTNRAVWRPTLRLVATLQLFDQEQIGLMGCEAVWFDWVLW